MDPRTEDSHLQALLAEAPFLNRLARSLCGAGMDSDELVQETWLVALRNPPRHLSSVRGWLAATLQGRLNNQRRREARLARREQAVARQETQPPGAPEIEALEVQARLLDMVRNLPEKQRMVIWMHFYGQHSCPEIAAELGLNPSTVRTQLARGLAKLRDELDKETPGGRAGWLNALAPLGAASMPASLPAAATLGAPILMKKILLAVSAVLLAGFSVYALLDIDHAGLAPGPATPVASAELPELAAVPAEEADPAGVTDTRQRAAVESPSASEPQGAPSQPWCQIFGRVVDADDLPLRGVSIQLESYQEWGGGADATLLELDPPHYGWKHNTAEDGTFRFEVPMPTSKYISLRVTPGDYLESKLLIFGGTRAGRLEPLKAGARDLGTIRLLGAGSVSGRVTDGTGAPLQGVRVGTGLHRGNAGKHWAETDAHGRYRCTHVLPGVFGVSATHGRFVSQFLEPYSIEVGRETTGVDFTMAPAPTLQGLVKSQAGDFLAGVEISCWPDKLGSRASAVTESDGRFVVYLPQEDMHSLQANLEGYQPWGLEHGGQLYDPGTSDLEIVMQEDIATEFRVVDGETGEPVQRFGLRIERDKGRLSEVKDPTSRIDAPTATWRQGGLAETWARPGFDRYWLFAPGYLEAQGEVSHDAGSPGQQTLRLSRGASFQGRIVRDGQPQPGLSVRLTPVGMWGADRRKRNALGTGDGKLKTIVFDWNETQVVKTDPRGAFTFSGVKADQSYQLEASGTKKERARLLPLTHPGRGEVDLGDLELQPLASVRAQVRVPAGVEVERIQFYLDGWKDGHMVAPDKDGSISIEGLSHGLHLLVLKDLPGSVVGGKSWELKLEPGETRELTLDLHDRGLCEVSIRVDAGDLPVEGLSMFLRTEAAPGSPATHLPLGKLDAAGHLNASVLACGSAHMFVSGPTFERVKIPSEHIDFQLGSEHHVEFTLEMGSAKMVLPRGVPWPASTHLYFEGNGFGANVSIEQGQLQTAEPWLDGEGADWVRFHMLTPGKHEITLMVFDQDKEDEDSRTGNLLVWEGTKTFQVEVGQETELHW